MNMEQFLGFVGELIIRLEKKARNDQLKQRIKEIIEKRYHETESHYEEFLDSYMLLIGSQIIGLFVIPLNPEEKANSLIDNLIGSFRSFEHSLIDLLKLIQSHRESIKKVLNDDEWLSIEPILYCIKDDTIDWQFLIKHPIFSDFIGIKPENKFIRELNTQAIRIPNEMKFLKTDLKDELSSIYSSEEFDKLMKKAEKVGKKSKRKRIHDDR